MILPRTNARASRPGKWTFHPPREAARLVRYIAVMALCCGVIGGCADTQKSPPKQSSESSLRQRVDQAFDHDMPTVTGAEDDQFDRKGFRRDWDRFWNP